jgi:outer membrane receptor protein involved in Fe transport
VRLRAELELRPSPGLRVRAGADVQVDRLRPGPPPAGSPIGGAALALTRDAVVVGAHADAAWGVSPAVELTPGLRMDVYATELFAAPGAPTALKTAGGTATPVLEPRLAVRLRAAPGLTAVSTFGVSHQLPGIVAQYPETTPFLQPGVLTGLQSSVQASQGVEIALPAAFSLAATGFLHDYFGLPDVTACAFSPVDPSQCVTPTVRGRAFGLELLLRRPLGDRFAVWVSYTLSRSTREAHLPAAVPDAAQPATAPTTTILGEYDRTHVLSTVASYDLGREWRVGGRFYAYSGRPYTAFSLGAPVVPYDSQRLPGFFRIDARLEKAWVLGGKDRIALVLEGVNVTLNKEVVSATCGGPATASMARTPLPGSRTAQALPVNACTLDSVGPITIPSIGVEGTFR